MQPEEILKNYYSIVDFAAKRFSPIILQSTSTDVEDLKQEGVIALLAAYKTYTPNANTSFPTYAQTCVYNAMVSYLRKLDPLPSSVRRDLKTIEKIKTANPNPETPYTIEELVKLSKLTQDRIRKISLYNTIQYNIDDIEILDQTEASSLTPETQYIQQENINRIRQAIIALPDREQKILTDRIIHKKQLREIAEETNLTPARVSQIYTKVVNNLTQIYSDNN